MNKEQFLKLPKKDAQDLAEKMNLIFRLVSSDGRKILGMPEDERDDRICVSLEKGIVKEAVLQ
jgi:hypothetical protein